MSRDFTSLLKMFALLATCLSIIVALLCYLFYWNRFIAYIIGLLFHLMYWDHNPDSFWVGVGMLYSTIVRDLLLTSCNRLRSPLLVSGENNSQGYKISLK
jgi:hypothetical protein